MIKVSEVLWVEIVSRSWSEKKELNEEGNFTVFT